MVSKKNAITLIIISILPFVISLLVWLFAQSTHPDYSEKARYFLVIYSSIILAFLSGTYWPIGLSSEGFWAHYLIISSFMMLPVAVLSLLFYSLTWVLFFLAIFFTGLFLTDSFLCYKKQLGIWLFSLRSSLVVVAVFTLLVSALYRMNV